MPSSTTIQLLTLPMTSSINKTPDNVPDPEVDFKGFIKKLSHIVDKHRVQWNPVSMKPKQLVDVKKIASMYGGDG